TAGGGRGGHGLHPHKTGGPFIFLFEFPQPVVEGGQGNAPGCAEFFLALPAVRKFLHQEGHLFSFVHKLRFLCKAIGQKIIGKHVLDGADTLRAYSYIPIEFLAQIEYLLPTPNYSFTSISIVVSPANS